MFIFMNSNHTDVYRIKTVTLFLFLIYSSELCAISIRGTAFQNFLNEYINYTPPQPTQNNMFTQIFNIFFSRFLSSLVYDEHSS